MFNPLSRSSNPSRSLGPVGLAIGVLLAPALVIAASWTDEGDYLAADGDVLVEGGFSSARSPAEGAVLEVSGGQIAIQQQSVEGDARIFADYAPHHAWGIYHDNTEDVIHFTHEGGAGLDSWSELGPDGSGGYVSQTATSVAQIRLGDGSAYFYGNLGVGTTSPIAKLEVDGDAFVAGDLRLSNSRAEIWAEDRNHMIVLRGTQDGAEADMTSYYQYGGALTEQKGHRFFTGGDVTIQEERLRIADDGIYAQGPIGIGTETPAYSLSVSGLGEQLVEVSSDTTAGLFLRGGGTPGWKVRDSGNDAIEVVRHTDANNETQVLSVETDGTLHVSGNIVSDGDICIGACS